MRIKFTNGVYIETSGHIRLCREGENEEATVMYSTRSRKGQVEVDGAGYVSGMRGSNYPYKFEATTDQQGEDMVTLLVNDSSNPVWWTNRYNESKRIQNGQLNIRNDCTVAIGGRFQVTVQV